MTSHGPRHAYPRPHRGTLPKLGAILVLVAAALYVAVFPPIPTPSGPPAAYAAEGPEVGAAPAATAPPAPPDLASGPAPAFTPVPRSADASRPILPLPAPTDPGRPASAPSIAPLPQPSAPPQKAIARSPCQPARFALSDLGIDAAVVRLTLTPDGDLGTPRDSDKTRAGWFPSVLAGAERGTVLMDGHTYHDDSALFKTTFERQVRAGMVMRLSCADGRSFSYRIAEVVLDLTPDSYRAFVENRALYAADGPPQLVMITCTDYDASRRVWNHRVVLVATPVS